jgi:citrate synthase
MSGFGHRVYKNYDPRAKVSISMHSFEFVDLYGLHLERIK